MDKNSKTLTAPSPSAYQASSSVVDVDGMLLPAPPAAESSPRECVGTGVSVRTELVVVVPPDGEPTKRLASPAGLIQSNSGSVMKTFMTLSNDWALSWRARNTTTYTSNATQGLCHKEGKLLQRFDSRHHTMYSFNTPTEFTGRRRFVNCLVSLKYDAFM